MKFHEKSLCEIHKAILDTQTFLGAAEVLSVPLAQFSKYLRRFRCNGVDLSHTFLKALNVEQAIKKFTLAKYDLPLREEKPPLDQRTLREIHQAILNTKILPEAADLLNVAPNVLSKYLRRFRCNWAGLSYALLKVSNVEQAIKGFTLVKYERPLTEEKPPLDQQITGEKPPLDQKITGEKPSLDQQTLQEIHKAIRSTNGPEEAAHLLGVTRVELSKYLVGRRCKALGLSYTVLKALNLDLWVKVLTAKKYNQPLGQYKLLFNELTLKEIHYAIKDANSLEEAADFLCVAPAELLRCLGYFRCNEAGLTYDILKSLSSEQVIQAFTYKTYNQVLINYQPVVANNIEKRNRSDDEAPALNKKARLEERGDNNVGIDSYTLDAFLDEEPDQRTCQSASSLLAESDEDESILDKFIVPGDSFNNDVNRQLVMPSDMSQKRTRSESSLFEGFFKEQRVVDGGGSTQELQLNTPGYP